MELSCLTAASGRAAVGRPRIRNHAHGEVWLIALLTADPPLPDAQISAKLGIPAGSIVSRRSRCLDKLRRDPAIVALHDAHAAAPRAASCPGRQRRSVNNRSMAALTDALPRQESG